MAWFHARALLLAWRLGDEFGWDAATRPADVAALLELARGSSSVAELGTATGWGSAALLLADRDRRVVSFDPVVQEHRARYLALLPRRRARAARARAGRRCAGRPAGRLPLHRLDALARGNGARSCGAWLPELAAGRVVVLHDYGNPAFPGVATAVAALDLAGEPAGGSFVHRVPAR